VSVTEDDDESPLAVSPPGMEPGTVFLRREWNGRTRKRSEHGHSRHIIVFVGIRLAQRPRDGSHRGRARPAAPSDERGARPPPLADARHEVRSRRAVRVLQTREGPTQNKFFFTVNAKTSTKHRYETRSVGDK